MNENTTHEATSLNDSTEKEQDKFTQIKYKLLFPNL